MKTVSLSGFQRGGVGKKDAATVRKEGKIPGVLYGGKEQIHFNVNDLDIRKIVYSPEAYIVELDLGGTKYRTVLQEIQFHPVTDRILHFDLLQLFDDKSVKVNLPVRIAGTSPGVMQGGKLAVNYRSLPVKGLPANLPDAISVDISNLKVAENIRIRDLKVDGCQIMQPAASVVVAVKATRASIAAGTSAEA
jgi:large subunit ribosomal protein L25